MCIEIHFVHLARVEWRKCYSVKPPLDSYTLLFLEAFFNVSKSNFSYAQLVQLLLYIQAASVLCSISLIDLNSFDHFTGRFALKIAKQMDLGSVLIGKSNLISLARRIGEDKACIRAEVFDTF